MYNENEIPVFPDAPKEASKPGEATDLAFFTSSLASDTEGFDRIYNNLVDTGYDESVALAQGLWEEEQNFENKTVIAGLIADPTIDKATKTKYLSNYVSSGYVSRDLSDKYAQELGTADNSDTFIEQEAQDFQLEGLPQILQQAKVDRENDDFNDWFQDSLGEVASLVNIPVAIVGAAGNVATMTYVALMQKYRTGEIDWKEVAATTENLEEGWTPEGALKMVNTASIRPLAELVGLEDDFDESYTNKVFGKIGEGFQWLAEKIAEKRIFGIDSPEQALYFLDVAGFVGPAAILKGKSALKNMKHKPNGGADVATKANPKAAGDVLVEAVTDDTGKKAKQLNTKNENIVAENIHPKNNTEPPKDVVPDINKRFEEIKSIDEFSEADRIVFETYFDDNVTNREVRLSDRNRRVKVAEDSGLSINIANSDIFMDVQTLNGNIRFTQTPDYAFTTKKSVLDKATRIEELINKSQLDEIADNRKAGFNVDEKAFKKDNVRILDLKSGQKFTIDEFKKTKLDGRKFAIDWEFRKKYDFTAEQMLGTPLWKSGISFAGVKEMTKQVKARYLGEHLFGTGFAAKWFEQARAQIAPKAGRIKRELGEEFNLTLAKHKQHTKDFARVVEVLDREKKNTLTMTELAREFPGYNSSKLEAINEIQTAWRKMHDMGYEISNAGKRMALTSQGFNKAYFGPDGFAGAVRPLSKNSIKELGAVDDLVVYDPITKTHVNFKRNKSIEDNLVSQDGRVLVKMPKEDAIARSTSGKLSEYMLVKSDEIDNLPRRVMTKAEGHFYKEYKSKMFVEVIPKSMVVNGKTIQNIRGLEEYTQVKGTATTRTKAETLVEELRKDYPEDDFILNIRNSSQSLADNINEYSQFKEIYYNAKHRVKDMKSLADDDVLLDPKVAAETAINRMVNTSSYAMFDKAFEQAFRKDFDKVLTKNRFPVNLDEISARGNPKLALLEKEARSLWTRQKHFQNSEVMAFDRAFQNNLHGLADIFEKIKIPGIADVGSKFMRDLGDLGFTGVGQKIMGVAGTLYITFANPIRQMAIQPMMFFEQAVIHPKSFFKTMSRAPMHMLGLIHQGNPMFKATYNWYVRSLNPKARKEFLREHDVLRQQGILESINLHMALQETLKGRVTKLTASKNVAGRVAEKVGEGYQTAKDKFNKYGFTSAELYNRIGLWLQNKERWADMNPGKSWDNINTIENISFEAWKQSGSMTKAGSLAFQRIPGLNFLTQFQSIGHKAFMNTFQGNATNLSAGQRVALSANRLVMHGVEFGAPLAAGKLILDYLREHEDPAVREAADELANGVVDRWIKAGSGANVSLSEQASVTNINMFADLYENFVNMKLHMFNDPNARPVNIPSVKAIGRVTEKLDDIVNMFQFNPVTPELLLKASGKMFEVTSFGNSAMKAIEAYYLGEAVSKNGMKRGIPITGAEAVFKAMGLNTRAEIDQFAQKQIMQKSQDKIREGVDHYDKSIMAALKMGNFEEAKQALNTSLSMLQQQGYYTNYEVKEITKQILSRHKQRLTRNETYNIWKWTLQQDKGSPDTNKMMNRFGNHPDQRVKEFATYGHTGTMVRDEFNFNFEEE